MSLSKYHHRTNLLEMLLERKYSVYTEEKILLLIGSIEPSLKEEAAKRAIPLVEKSKTEEEALEKVREVVESLK